MRLSGAHRSLADSRQAELFAEPPAFPGGLVYAVEFITPEEEASLIEGIQALPLLEARYKQHTAKRRIASYGSAYDFESKARLAAPSIPALLMPLRDRAARWAGLPAGRFVHALVSEYRPGTALGWHRDVPDFELIAGVSLGTSCRMRFRPFPSAATRRRPPAIRPQPAAGHPSLAPFELELEPRSAYVMQGPIRWGWQHSIPPTKSLRYSVTFRTLRERQ